MLIAEPKTLNYGLVGTAFDYRLRFRIERENKCDTRPWIASLWSGSSFVAQSELSEAGLDIDINYMSERSSSIEDINSEARTLLDLYLKTGNMTDALIESALKLATIDIVFRSGRYEDQIGIVNPLDIADLSNLFELIDADKFKSNQSCYLNPTFGIGSELVNGADADLIIDGALIDIKTTKKSDFSWAYFDQLVGYLLLHAIDCEHQNIPRSIERLGIYFSRHNCLFLVNVTDLIDESMLPDVVHSFRNLVKQSGNRR
ncbi:hypothetical protein GALL_463610 [mine drainage metagenome]|uniref:PD-(D/E)XK endonuclease-like domain-containing protein n=1 Tax=mine drainage metagenome TaxID=410659 RepID=A0A1J5PWT3_9ZZZZ